VLGSRIEGNLLILDFNKEIKNYGGTAREEGILKQILYSMKQLKNIEKIRILIEGKKDHLPKVPTYPARCCFLWKLTDKKTCNLF